MGSEKNSELIRLMRGERGSLWLTRGERRMLKFALDTFGESLTSFLLAGLGEEEEGKVRLFTVAFTDSGGASYRREIRVEADDRPDIITLLPRRREPLVMLTFLYILLGRQPFSPSMFYDQEQVLKPLDWEDSSSSRLSIDETVERYAILSYRWGLSEEELAEKNLSTWQAHSRFVSGYGYQDVEEMKGRQIKRVLNCIDFSAEFISGLMSRSLFRIDWNNVRYVKFTKATQF